MRSLISSNTLQITARSPRSLQRGAPPQIQKQESKTGVSVEKLETAMADVMEALSSISTYKQEALPKMRNAINQFKELAAKGEELIQQLEKGHKLEMQLKKSIATGMIRLG